MKLVPQSLTIDQFLSRLIKQADDNQTCLREAQRLIELRETCPRWLLRIKLHNLERQDCQDYWDQLNPVTKTKSSQTPQSKESAREQFSLFRQVLDKAVDEYMEANPANDIDIPKPARRLDALHPDNVLETDELVTLLHKQAQGNRPDLYVCFSLMAVAGLQAREVLALRRQDIQLEFVGPEGIEPRIRVRNVGKRRVREAAGDRRGVHLAPSLVRLLAQWLSKVSKRPNGFVFRRATRAGGRLQYHDLVHAWRTLQKEVGTRSPLPLKSLRDTFAALLLDGGEDIIYVSRQLGYKSVAQVEQRYKHWIEREGRGKLAQVHGNLSVPMFPKPEPSQVVS